METKRNEQVFMVRIWQEPSDMIPAGVWRGSVKHIPSDKQTYFSSIEDLLRFLSGIQNKAITKPY